MKIGFAGLGGMGSAMATNLVQAGFALTVWNRSPQAAQPLVNAGARQAERPEQLADADVLITMLADDAATQQVVVDSGLLQRMKPGALHINMATISVELAKRLTTLHAEHGIGYLAAPVLGRIDVAAAGKLNILAAGDSERLKQAQPLFDALGQKTWHFGADPAQANVVKIATNFTLASAIEAMAEGSALVRNYGVSGADYLQMLSSTVFAAPAYQGYEPNRKANRPGTSTIRHSAQAKCWVPLQNHGSSFQERNAINAGSPSPAACRIRYMPMA